MKKAKPLYLKHKINLYFDENFPVEIIEELKKDNSWKRRCRIYSVYDFGNQNKDDPFQFKFCKKRGFALVTLDTDFMNDTNYPFGGIPGIITIVAKGNDLAKIKYCLDMFLSFISHLPLPKIFLGDSKFQVSERGCVMRGRDYQTGEIKTFTIVPGDTLLREVIDEFNYLT